MKNQSINTPANRKADFLDIKTAKNPIYQPLAGKSLPEVENKRTLKDEQSVPAKNESMRAGEPFLESLGVAPQNLVDKEAVNTEIKKEQPALNLEATLKLVEELHRRMVQRGRLVYTIDNLEKFEIEQKEEAEDAISNYYQGCELEITDDKRNKFSTKNPVIIKAVATFVKDLCTNRLAEIEAEITIPV